MFRPIRIAATLREIDDITRRLELTEEPAVIEMHPTATLHDLSVLASLDLASEVTPEAATAIRQLIVHPRTDGPGVDLEIVGRLSEFILRRGGRVVAEEGFEPPTPGL